MRRTSTVTRKCATRMDVMNVFKDTTNKTTLSPVNLVPTSQTANFAKTLWDVVPVNRATIMSSQINRIREAADLVTTLELGEGTAPMIRVSFSDFTLKTPFEHLIESSYITVLVIQLFENSVYKAVGFRSIFRLNFFSHFFCCKILDYRVLRTINRVRFVTKIKDRRNFLRTPFNLTFFSFLIFYLTTKYKQHFKQKKCFFCFQYMHINKYF